MNLDKFSIKNEIVVITGGAGLLGEKHAESVSEIGGIPFILDIDHEKSNEVINKLNDKYACGAGLAIVDITDERSVLNVLEEIKLKYKKIPYGLINNAAIDPKFDDKAGETPKSRFEVFSLQQWELEIKVGLTGSFICSKIFGTEMARVGKGVILNIASDLGTIAPDQRIYREKNLKEDMQKVKPVTYSVVKHGLIGLTKYLATYFAEKGVRVNSLSPGGVYTSQPDDFVERLTGLIPMGRMAKVDEYKGVVMFMLSDASSYMTGANLVVDGGRSCW